MSNLKVSIHINDDMFPFDQTMMQTFATPPVQGLPPSSMYRVAPSIGVPVGLTGQKPVQPQMEPHLVRLFSSSLYFASHSYESHFTMVTDLVAENRI